MSKLLQVNQVTKTFGGLTAVDNVSFDIPEGEIMGMIGPNGAGKTTVFNLITGIYEPDQGQVYLDEEEITGLKPHVITQRGIARTFQTIRLFPNLTALENVMSGRHCRTRSGVWSSILRLRSQREEEQAIMESAREYLAEFNLLHYEDELAKNLPYGEQRRLEIARALATEPRLLVLDEPAAGLNDTESEELNEQIRAVRESGVTVLLIEHDMAVVMEVCEHVIVLDNGAKIADGTPEEVQNNEAVIRAYLGDDDDEWFA